MIIAIEPSGSRLEKQHERSTKNGQRPHLSLDPLLKTDDADGKTGNEDYIIENLAESVEDSTGTTASKRKLWSSFLGAFLATAAQVGSVLGSEITQFQERGCAVPNVTTKNTTAVSRLCIEAFNSPFMSIWFNHSFTGPFSMSIHRKFIDLLVTENVS